MRIRFLALYPVLACSGMLLGSQAHAGFFDTIDSAYRVGFGAGSLAMDGDNPHLAGFSVITGYEYNRYISAELSWVGGSDAFYSVKRVAGGSQVDTVGNHYWNASLLGSWPFNDMISAYGRVGMLHYGGNSVVTAGTTVTRSDLKGNSPFYGIGAAISIDNGMLRVEYDRSKIVDQTVSYISFSAVWKFTLK